MKPGPAGEPEQRGAGALLRWMWSQWWLLTAGWWVCALLAVQAVRHTEHKSMLAVFGNLILGCPLLAPFALYDGCRPMLAHWRPLLFIGVMNGLEINLGNSSLYTIGASLKTAMGGFNVICTFLIAALLGADEPARNCLLGCQCSSNILFTLAIAMVSGGCVFTAVVGNQQWDADLGGILLQLSSSVFYAFRYTAIKLLFKNADEDRPSKFQTAFVINPVTGFMALFFLPFFEDTWQPPGFQSVLTITVAILGILLFELRLVEITSPLTVSVLAIIHNVVIVLFFSLFKDDTLSPAMIGGFALSTVGSLCYAFAKRQQLPEDEPVQHESQALTSEAHLSSSESRSSCDTSTTDEGSESECLGGTN